MNRVQNIKETRRVLFVILILNWVIAGIKILVGLTANSSAVLSNGIESFADGASNIVGLVALKFCMQPSDENHPYGHGKFETFATAFIGSLLIYAGYKIFREAIHNLYNYFANGIVPDVSFEPILIIILAATLVANVFIVTYELRKGKQLKSNLLIADAQHTRADLLATSVVIVSTFLTNVFPLFDPILSLIISLFIFHTAYEIFRDITQVFSDKARVKPKDIKKVVEKYPEVYDVHKVRSRGMSNQIFMDFHLNMKKDLSLYEAHHITELIEKDIFALDDNIIDITIHMEPK